MISWVGQICEPAYVPMGIPAAGENIDLMSTDNISDGALKKKWTALTGKRILVNGGSGVTKKKPYNEMFASRIIERLGGSNVQDFPWIHDGYPSISICENFISPNNRTDTRMVHS